MARRITRKTLKQDEFVEAAFDFGAWLQRHRRSITLGAAAVAAGALLLGGFVWWKARAAEQTRRFLNEALSRVAVETPEADAEALELFEKAARTGRGTPAGQVAAYYQAATLLDLDRTAEAVQVLEALHASLKPGLLSDLAQAKLAWSYERAGQAERAVEQWKQIAARSDAYFPPDLALLNAGDLLWAQGNEAEARRVWQDSLARFPSGAAAEDARNRLTRPSPEVAGS